MVPHGTFVLCTASSRCMRIDDAERSKRVHWVWGGGGGGGGGGLPNLTPTEIISACKLGMELAAKLASVSHCLYALKRCSGKCDSAMLLGSQD